MEQSIHLQDTAEDKGELDEQRKEKDKSWLRERTVDSGKEKDNSWLREGRARWTVDSLGGQSNQFILRTKYNTCRTGGSWLVLHTHIQEPVINLQWRNWRLS